MELDLEQKQNYLRTEIIEQGYDPDKFSAFITGEKGDIGLDLNNWNFEDLKEIVNKFKTQNSNKTENINNTMNKNSENNLNENNNEDINSINQKNFENVNNQNEINKINENEIKNNEESKNIPNTNYNNINNNFEILSHVKEYNEYIPCVKQEKNEFTEMKNFKIKITK